MARVSRNDQGRRPVLSTPLPHESCARMCPGFPLPLGEGYGQVQSRLPAASDSRPDAAPGRITMVKRSERTP